MSSDMSNGIPSAEVGPCPRCGATECKRWKMLNGADVCDECWLDTAQDMLASGGWRIRLRQPFTATASHGTTHSESKSGQRTNPPPRRILHPTVRRNRDAVAVKGSCSRVINHNWRIHESDLRGLQRATEQARRMKILNHELNSICQLCGHIFYGAAMSSCSRCGGVCNQYTDHDLMLMGRWNTHLVEAEK